MACVLWLRRGLCGLLNEIFCPKFQSSSDVRRIRGLNISCSENQQGE